MHTWLTGQVEFPMETGPNHHEHPSSIPSPPDLDHFRFHGLHPRVFIGTASDRYAGWLEQIYTPARYQGRIQKRANKVGGKSFASQVLPVDSVAEYFEHFPILELDFTFYRPLLEADGAPGTNYYTLQQYAGFLKPGDRVFIKAPQVVTAMKIRRAGGFVPNEDRLNPDLFTRLFYEPATRLLGDNLGGILFEQEYQRKQERQPVDEVADSLHTFFSAIPQDPRYHLELRTETYLAGPVFQVLALHGAGQVLSHWTWLPPLRKQFERGGKKVYSSAGDVVIRLMTPRGTRYEDAYAKAHPFNALVDGMMTPSMPDDVADTASRILETGPRINIVVNNRSGGNAPLIAKIVARRLLEKMSSKPAS